MKEPGILYLDIDLNISSLLENIILVFPPNFIRTESEIVQNAKSRLCRKSTLSLTAS